MKTCYKCGETLTRKLEFYKNRSRPDGFDHVCKACRRAFERPRKQRKRPKGYMAEASAASRRAHCPSWANRVAMREFYSACPDGHVVDHIIPVNGENVKGLHILENLQYLTPKENTEKGNKLL